MAVNAAAVAGGKPGGKKRKKQKKLGPGDPPIFVGGGGSTLIWIRNDFTLTQIPLADVGPKASHPKTKSKYQIWRCDCDVTTSTVRLDQSGGQSKHTGLSKEHSTEFE
jgi:hypothetical protein